MASTALGRQLTDENRRWQAILGTTVAASALDLASMIDPEHVSATFDAWQERMIGLQLAAYTAGTDQATTYVRAFRSAELGAAQASRLPVVRPPFDPIGAAQAVGWAPWQAAAAINQGMEPSAAWDMASRAVAGRMQREAITPGRQVVLESARHSGGRWRRVSDGMPCAFCAMLVIRGPMYSESSVEFQAHNHCGCTAEEVFGHWQPNELEQRWQDVYDEAHHPGMDGAETAAAMRQSGGGVFHDASTPVMRGGSGGSSGGKPPSLSTASSGGKWSEEERARRQIALGIDTHGETLTQEEVQFSEHFLRVHPGMIPTDVMEWIPRNVYNADGGLLPTNDFRWVARGGIEVELKTSSSWRTIRDHIKRAVIKASEQGVVKENFVIDIGAGRLTPTIRRNLERWNKDRASAQIRSVWVLSGGGAELEQINLLD